MKNNGLWVAALAAVMATGIPVMAQESGAGGLTLDGVALTPGVYEQEGQLYLPVRAVSEALGYRVTWSDADQTVLLAKAGDNILLDYKEGTVAENGHERFMAGKVFHDGRAYMPADFFVKSMGVDVKEDGQGNAVLQDYDENNIIIDNARLSDKHIAGLDTDIQYPQISGLADPAVQDAWNKTFLEAALASARQGEANAEDLRKYMQESGISWAGMCASALNYEVSYNHNDVLSVVFQDYQFAGGAHGGVDQFAYTFNLKTGRIYEMKDFFLEGTDYMGVINSAVKAGLEERELTWGLFEPFTSVREDQGFHLSDQGLMVYFQQYEILAYAAGIQEFAVDYDRMDFMEP